MIKFVVLTLVAYIAIDIAVYWLGNKASVTFTEIVKHHLKMIPIYLIANIFITFGFIQAITKSNPIILFSLSILLWVMSLLIVSLFLYKTYPNWLTIVGFSVVIVGIVLVHKSFEA